MVYLKCAFKLFCDPESQAQPGYMWEMFFNFLSISTAVILGFDKQYPKQNTVARLQSNILAP